VPATIDRSTARLPELVRVAMARVQRGASYLSDAERRSFDGYDGPIAVGDPAGQRPAIRPTRRGA